MKNILFVVLMLFNVALSAEIMNEKYYTLSYTAKMTGSYDPSYVVIKLKDGTEIESKSDGVSFDTLYDWKYPRNVIFSYNVKDGIMIQDIKTKKIFALSGKIKNHPIDMAEKNCIKNNPTTMGIVFCKTDRYTAWDAELNRIYKRLGGSKNKELKSAQLQWIKYKKEAHKLISKEYNKGGTIWQLFAADRLTSITKEQTLFLQSIYEDR